MCNWTLFRTKKKGESVTWEREREVFDVIIQVVKENPLRFSKMVVLVVSD